jgi:hypothetical protein
MQRSAVSLGRGIPENGSDGLGLGADFSYWQCYEDEVFGKLGLKARLSSDGPIAQLDRVTDFYSVGCRFESCWDRQYHLSAVVFDGSRTLICLQTT